MRLFQAHINSADSDLISLSEYLSIPSNGLDSQSSGGSRRLKRIANAFSKASAKTRAIQRTTRNEETLSSVQNHLNNAWRVLNEIRLIRIEEGIKAITLGEREEFKGRVVVQPNPENLVLDFESMDENGAAVTCEGKLKQAKMQPGSSFVGVIDGSVAGAIGGGGMGKSCAVRGFTALQEVRDMFPGGIYEISLGLDAGELTLKKELCNCIEMSGGVILAKQTMSERNMNEVIRKAEGWFGNEKALFIVDDVWENEEISRNSLFSLKRLLGSVGSRMVFTSRSSSMKAISRDAVEFGLREPLSNTSRRMILENAQMKENDIKVKRNSASLSTLLKVCGGLPVALAVAGQLVREHGSEFDDPFGEVLTRIECHEGEVQMYNVPGYGALSGLLDAAIQFCQRRHSHEWTQRTGVSFENLVLSLCVLKRQQFAPVGMLRRLWGLENDSSTRELVKIMKNAGLVKEEIMQGKYKQVPGIRLHDLIHAHFHTKAGGRREKYHKQFLSRYIEHDPQQAYRAWWQVDGQEDNYIYLNIFTHLLMAGLNNEAALLSLDPRWTVKQFRVNGEVQVFYDHSWLKTNLVKVKSIPTSDLAGIPEALELISDAITLAAPYVVRNEREIWFQLYGRLLQRESIVLDGYLEKIRRHAERSRLRAAGKCMTQAGGLITGLWAMDRAKFLVLDVWVGQDDWVLVFGKIKHAESEVYEMWRLEKRSQSKQKRIWFVTIRGKAMQSFASDNGRKLGLVVGDGRLQLWDTENDKQLGCEQNSCEQNSCEQDAQDATEFGKFSANGTMCAFVSRKTKIKVWKVGDEKAEEMCSLNGPRSVSSFCWSVDGKSVAVGCRDGHVTLWDLNSKEVKKEFDIGHGNRIINLVWSGDGVIATYAAKKGMSIWDVPFREGKVPREIFQSQNVWWHMKWSPDGRYLAVATTDTHRRRVSGKVTVLEMHKASGAQEVSVFNCWKPIVCLNWSHNGKRLVFGDMSRIVWMAQPLSADGKQAIQGTEEEKQDVVRLPGQEERQKTNEDIEDIEAIKRYECDRHLLGDGELLADVFSDRVSVWNIQSREPVLSLRSETELRRVVTEELSKSQLSRHGNAALSKDGSKFAARTRRILSVCNTHEKEWWHSEDRYLFKTLSLSDDGRFLCGLSNSTFSIEVLEFDGLEGEDVASSLPLRREVHKLCFDKQNDVLIEYVMRESDLADDSVEQFSVWRWRSQSADELALPLNKRRACLVGGRKFFDEKGRCLATFEEEFEQWGFSEESGALTMLTDDGRLVRCFLETT